MIRCVAIDDEPIDLNIIKEYCRRYGDMDVECFSSPHDGFEYIIANHPDIVFINIELQKANGLDLGRRLPEGTCIIFTSAFSQYAIDGYNVGAIDFLHKPIYYTRFQHAIRKSLRYLGHSVSEPGHRTIVLKVERRTTIIDLTDIVNIEAMDNYMKIIRRNAPVIMSQITMKELDKILPHDTFLRVHRSFIVNMHAIDCYVNRCISFRNSSATVPVGRKYLQQFNEIYKPHEHTHR